ncbi:MAG: hypothetical protein R3220_10370 [Balneolaceae bacterium]|nr:hypothetical protein [Balneolaceae bacterium]
MKTTKTELLAGGVALATLAGVAYTGYQYRKHHRRYDRKFDPETVEDTTGVIEEVHYTGRENGEDRGVELILKSGEDLIPVHLGPAWFMDMQDGVIKKGDKITVKGSSVVHNHTPVIIAMELHYKDRVLRLRDPNGHPFWSAWDRLS